MRSHITDSTPLNRRTGIAYLGIVVFGIFAEFFVRMSLVVPDEPVTTAQNIAGSTGLFAAGIGADATMVALDVAVAVGLYRLLRHVDHRLALFATGTRLVQATILAGNLLNPVRARELAGTAVETAAIGPAEQALAAMEAQALVYDIALIAFALSCLAIARLLHRTGEAPRWLPIGMYATGVVYLVGSFAAVFAPGLSGAIDPFYGIAIIVEPAFAIWLIVRGIAAPRTTTPIAAAVPA